MVLIVDDSSNYHSVSSAGSNGEKTIMNYHLEFEHIETA